VNSSGPPKGFDGLSASIAFMTSTGLPVASGITKMWLRSPVDQVSQCRTGSSVYTIADMFCLLISLRHEAVSSTDVPGKISIVKARLLPSGEIFRLEISRGVSVT